MLFFLLNFSVVCLEGEAVNLEEKKRIFLVTKKNQTREKLKDSSLIIFLLSVKARLGFRHAQKFRLGISENMFGEL
jgi:hypothetical protein